MRKAQRQFAGAVAAVAACLALSQPGLTADRQLHIAPVKPPPAGERRIALIIGNSAYKASPLKNPVNDARAISKALSATGFDVTVLEDASQATMRRAMRSFGDELQRGGVGLFYYAGHGMQVRGKNYLIPVNADIQREDEVEDQAVDANVILAKMDSAKNSLNLMILDACRNNPFARSFRSAAQGLAQMDAPSGTLIAFATAPGSVAADGEGANGLYTKHLLANLAKPGLPVEQLFKEVRIGVTKETGDRQVPWESSSLKGNFFFVPGEATLSAEDQRREIEKTIAERLAAERTEQQRQMERVIQEMLAKQRAALEEEMKKRGEAIAAAKPVPAPAPAAPAFDRSQMELSFWDSIKNSTNPEDYKAYLAQYPKGTFAALARSRANPPKPAAPVAAAAPAQAPKPAPSVAALKPIEPPRPAVAPVQVASAAPTSMIGMGIDDPRFPKIGDLWEYSYADSFKGTKKQARFEAVAVSKDGILEAGGFTDSRPSQRAHAQGPSLRYVGDVLQFSPFLLSFGSVKEGDSWNSLLAEGDPFCARPGTSCRYDAKVAGREKVMTAAGTFDAIKVVVDFNGGYLSIRTWRQHTFWYSEEIKRLVRITARTLAGNSMQSDYEVELTSYTPASQRTPGTAGVQLASAAQTSSLGTGIDDPRFPKIGDHWEYRYTDAISRLARKARVEIVDVSKDAIYEEVDADAVRRQHSAEARLAFNRNWLEFSPYLLSFGEPRVGESWDLRRAEHLAICQGHGANCRFELRALSREKVVTPAGTFDAVKIEGDWNGNLVSSGSNSAPSWRRITYWYSESAKRLVKATVRTRSGITTEPDYDVELTAFKLH